MLSTQPLVLRSQVKLQGFHDRLKQEFDIVEGYDTEASVTFIEVSCGEGRAAKVLRSPDASLGMIDHNMS